jgi:Uma2 family endonuclease
MSIAIAPPTQPKVRGGNRLVLDNVPWEMYIKLLQAFGTKRVRLTYDERILEIMTLSYEHESGTYFLGRMVDVLTEELGLPVKAGRSTTMKRRKKLKGLEPDNCYWIAREHEVRGKKKLDLRKDPPPDLALEIDITHSSLNRMAIYAALHVPEVWRYDGNDLTFFVLNEQGEYQPSPTSKQFPFLKPSDLMPFLTKQATMEENAIIREFREWLRVNAPKP